MIRTILIRMADPFYLRAYLGFIPFLLIASYGLCLIWKGCSGDTVRGVPRWTYFAAGLICILTLPGYGLFLKHQGLL